MVQFMIKIVVYNSSKIKHINLYITATAYKSVMIVNFIFLEEHLTSFLNCLRTLCQQFLSGQKSLELFLNTMGEYISLQ